LRDYLAQKYIPACRESIAASSLPDGTATYAYRVRWHTTTNLTPKQIHETGLAEVKRIRAEMDKVMASTGFAGTFADFTNFLRTDARFYFETPEALVNAYRVIAKRADPELVHLFGKLPRLTYGVVEIPAFKAPSQTTAYYEQGSPEAGRPGHYFVNTYNLKARPKWEMEALSLHESVPGHHVQISLAQEIENVPEFRKHIGYSAFVEGWALYAESLGPEMGFYTDPYSKFGQLTYEMWRAVRLVVDTGMHAMGWSREKAIQFFRENTGKTDQDIVVEVDRYIVWPGQALAYKIGQLKIRELRTQAERELGERFKIRAFHDAVLAQGAVPLGVLDEHMNAWLPQQKATANAPAAGHIGKQFI
jgi:prolyl oligopeptidase